MSSPLPQLQCLVAFNNGPFDNPAAITTVASPVGTLGGVNVWTDITSSASGLAGVTGVTIRRGRQHELDQFEAGECQLELSNYDARFTPWNTSSPYFGLLLPRKLLQIRATWSGTTYTLFTGHVDAWPMLWPDPVSGLAEVHATDAFRLFQRADITSSGYPAQIVADGPVGYWRFGDVIGSTNVAPTVGTVYGTINPLSTFGDVTFGNPGALLANPGTSVSLGGPTSYGELDFATTVSSVANCSIEFWVNTGPSSNWSAVPNTNFAFTIGDGTNAVYVQFSDATGLILNYTPSGSLFYQGLGTPLFATGFHHFVVTWSSGVPTVYIDGVTVSLSTTVGTAVNPSRTSVVFSAVDTVNTPMFFQEFAIYNGALTPTQVANHLKLATFPQESTDARITQVLNTIGWPSAARSLDAGASNVQVVTSSLTQTSSLSHMQDCETTEAGALYMTIDGKVRFISRQTLWSDSRYQTSQATFGDNPSGGELVYQPNPALGLDDLDIYNEAFGQRQNGNPQLVDNNTSIAAYGRTTWQPNGTLLGISDAEVLGRLNMVLAQYAQPITRLASITVDLVDLITPNQVGTLLALELLYRVTVNRHGPPGGGTAFSQVGLVEHIQHTITADGWTVDLSLDPAGAQLQLLILGGPGTLGGPAVLGF